MKEYYKENAGVIYQGDCLEILKQMEGESVDMVITSPPYYGLRNYGIDGQIGLENTFDEFLEKMLEIISEVKRVLKKTGTFWLNMGDCYGGSNNGSNDYEENGKSSVPLKSRGPGAKRLTYWGGNVEKSTLTNPERQQLMGRSGNQKCMLMQPERLAITMIDKQGWILRNKIKWAKQVFLFKDKMTKGSVMPTSVKDRFNESGEELYFFVKNKKYFFDLDAVRLPNQVLGVSDLRTQQEINKYPEAYQQGYRFNYRVRDAERKKGQPQFQATEEEIKKYYGKDRVGGFVRSRDLEYDSKYNNPDFRKKSLEQRMDDTKNKDTTSSRTANIKKLLSEVRLGIKPNTGMIKRNDIEVLNGRRRDVGLYERMGENSLGKNLPTIWQIGSEPHNFQRELGVSVDHFAIFPQALCEIPIKAGCPKDGVIMDIFNGSGTTCLVAKKLGRKFIGIDLNKEYCDIAVARLKSVPQSLF